MSREEDLTALESAVAAAQASSARLRADATPGERASLGAIDRALLTVEAEAWSLRRRRAPVSDVPGEPGAPVGGALWRLP